MPYWIVQLSERSLPRDRDTWWQWLRVGIEDFSDRRSTINGDDEDKTRKIGWVPITCEVKGSIIRSESAISGRLRHGYSGVSLGGSGVEFVSAWGSSSHREHTFTSILRSPSERVSLRRFNYIVYFFPASVSHNPLEIMGIKKHITERWLRRLLLAFLRRTSLDCGASFITKGDGEIVALISQLFVASAHFINQGAMWSHVGSVRYHEARLARNSLPNY